MSIDTSKLENTSVQAELVWTPQRKFLLRTIVIYVIQLCIPLTPAFYQRLFSLEGVSVWQSVSRLTGFHVHRFVDVGTEIWELYSYINLVVAFVVALFIAAIWSVFDKNGKEINIKYNVLQYWALVIARYSSALGIIAWGFKKFVPKQMELPSRTFMETPFGDFSEQKIYWQYVGISQSYEVFLGFAEILIGLLLLYRRTTALGAFLLIVVLFNICLANHAYDGMVHVGSFIYTMIGVIILWPYVTPIWKLFIKREHVIPYHYAPSFDKKWQSVSRHLLKGAILLVFVGYNYYLHLDDHVGYRYPHEYPGLKGAAGTYEVTEFRLNDEVIPYSPLDSIRWQDAIFEDWSTFTILLNKKQHMDNANTARNEMESSINRRFEFRGIGGGRHYFDYQQDTVNRVLYLTNKNSKHRNETFVLSYDSPHPGRLVLEGVNQHNDSLYVVLDKREKDYALKADLIDWYYNYK